jgi:hypothetical protein
MSYAGEPPQEYCCEIRTLKCHLCDKKILRGEKFTWIAPNSRAYVNICDKCLVKLGELGKGMLKDNEEFLAMPLKERLKKLKMLDALKQQGQ